MNRMRKILSLKLWVPVLCIGLVILIAQVPSTKKMEMAERMEREKKTLGYSPHAETIQTTDWGKVISEGLVVVGSIATTARALIELIGLLKRRKNVAP